ncbi:MAG: hypothetical protein NTZ55_05765 [Candidatus Roizmanbacteria bacterium]|nr:hypothetical protein [Candidatus Roizmanbacteria bacterium]
MKNVIITAANANIGDFLVHHWLRSLKDSNNLSHCDVVVIDYGLTDTHIKELQKEKVEVIPGTKKYHIVNKRFFDAGSYLKKNTYDQILFVDSGDVIFQGDISSMFTTDPNSFRVVPLGKRILFYQWLIFNQFEDEVKRKIWKLLKNKPIINAGVIFAPTQKFIELCDEMEKLIRNKEEFGPDQIIVNYHLYKDSVKFIDSKYNFMMSTVYLGFNVRKGIFYKLNGEKILIVHNAGQMNIFRPIYNFGYGEQRNQIKHVMYFLKRTMYLLLELYKKYFK